MTDKARIGIIGTGWWASEVHIPGLKEHPQAELVAVCDTQPDRLQKAVTAYNIEHPYTDYHEMLDKEKLDGVLVVTPHATHYAITRDCLEHDLHVLLEKPMTLYARDARDLVRLAAEHQREIVIGYPYPFFAPFIHAREVMQSGELGTIQYVTSEFCTDVSTFLNGKVSPENSPVKYTVQGPSEAYNNPDLMGGGEGHLQLTHSIGAMFFVTGLRPHRVHALMNNLGYAVDMVDTMLVEFEGGMLGTVSGTGNAGHSYRMGLAVYCEAGCIVIDTMTRNGVIRRKDGSQEDLRKFSHDGSHYPTTHNFIDVILGKAQNGSTGELGWRVVELLDAAYRSAKADGHGILIEDLYK